MAKKGAEKKPADSKKGGDKDKKGTTKSADEGGEKGGKVEYCQGCGKKLRSDQTCSPG